MRRAPPIRAASRPMDDAEPFRPRCPATLARGRSGRPAEAAVPSPGTIATQSSPSAHTIQRSGSSEMRLLAIAVAVFVAGCSSGTPSTAPDVARRDALKSAVRDASVGSSVDLRSVLGQDWDRVIFLGPYSNNDGARDVV